MTLNSGFNNQSEEIFFDFIFQGSTAGTHFTLNELFTEKEFECTLPANMGSITEIDDIWFEDPLKNKSNARFYSKSKNQLSYIDDSHGIDKMALSWKNFREDVSFSYPLCEAGTNSRL